MKMTDLFNRETKESYEKTKKALISLFIFTLAILISIFMSPYITKYTVDGLKLCANTIIGSVFPCLILTDVIVNFTSFDKINWLRSAFEKIFNINGYAVTAYITGLICGFPLGVKVGVDLYKGGFISKGECERLIGFSNNTGPAFVMGGVGFGLRGSIKDGIRLYFSMLASSIIAGFIIGIGKHCTKKDAKCNYGAAYEFTASVKNAASNTLNICAFVVFFSVVSGILNLIVQNEAVYSVIVSLAEVSNAAKALAKGSFPRIISLILTSFAISFSGISVHMQARCFISETDISMKCYYGTKILQGTRAAAITALLSVF